MSINTASQAQSFLPVKKLAERQVPWLASKIVFSAIPNENGKEIFELSTDQNKVKIAASSASSAAMGLGWYLKYYCHRSVSHLGDNASPIKSLPPVSKKIRITAEVPLRYALNYCTLNYSMSFYGWKEWEKELDWMALNGVNLMLAPLGTEAVWQNTLKRMGFSEREILNFIPGSAFTAWWLMGNLEGWGGNLSQNTITHQSALAKKVFQRMKELGINPVMQSFYGIVPTSLKNKKKAAIFEQGKWAGGFSRPDFLSPEDPLFTEISDIYYTEVKKLYGADFHYFGGDPFHEGGESKKINAARAASVIQKRMNFHFPGSTWVLQGWQKNPSNELLSGLDKSKTLVIELFGENTNNWEKRSGYESTPFIWSNVSNFGEKQGLYGKLQRFAAEFDRAKNSRYGKLLKGVGIIPEGINNNPVAYDLTLELAWRKNQVEIKDWIKGYVRYRYGTDNEKLQAAWQIFIQTVYSSPPQSQEGPSESIFCARPKLDIESVSTWGTRTRNYDLEAFEKGVKLFVAAGKEISQNETYQTDRIDFVRQFQANRADKIYRQMIEAIKSNNQSDFSKSYGKFKEMLLKQDSLLNSSPYFSLSRWLQEADNFGKTKSEKESAIRNAKTQITYWGPDNPDTDLHDYAHKEWGGLLSSLYLERWEKFAANAVKRMNNQPVQEDYFQLEKNWANDPKMYYLAELSPEEIDNLVNDIIYASQ